MKFRHFRSKASLPSVALFNLTTMAAPMSDVTGYRSDGGGLGQDQGLSKNLRGILTAKLPLLSSPGTVLENSLYYDINSSSVTAVEQQETFNKDRIVLNNFQMGSSPSAYIPSVLFASTVFWIPEFDDATWNVSSMDATHTVCIPQGWGFAALDQIVVYMGASTIAQIQISGMTNYLINAATCETSSKRTAMLKFGGEYLNPMDKLSMMATPLNGSSFWRAKSYGDFFNTAATPTLYPNMQQAVVPLRLPWSSMAALDKRLSLDTKLSTQPIQITLFTKGLNEFAQLGSAVNGGANGIKSTWKSSTIQLWQEELSDKSLSVRNELLAMPEFNVGYPFQYAQSIPFDIIQSDSGLSSQELLMNITSIINSDLTTFLFNVTWTGRTNPASGQLCPLYGEILTNITLLLNGQRFFAFDEASYPAVTMAKQLDVPYQENLIMPSQNTTLSTTQSAGFQTNSQIYEFNNSRLRAIVSEANLQNTARFTNQTFQLYFQINRDFFYLAAPTSPNTADSYSAGVSKQAGYTLNMTYLYNACFLIGGDGGTTKLITN